MDTKKYLDLVGLKHYDSKIKEFIANSITNAEATYTTSFIKNVENGVWTIIDDSTLLAQAPTSQAVLDYVGTFAKSVKDTVESLSVNSKTFGANGEVVLYAGDIAMSNTDTTTVKDEIDALKGAVSGGTFFRGVFDSKEQVTDPKNGDVIAVGNKEYIYYAESTETDKWIELGDTTAEGQRIGALEDAIADMDAEYALDAEGTGEGEVAVVTGVNLTQVDGKITAMTVDSAKAATKAYVDTQDAALQEQIDNLKSGLEGISVAEGSSVENYVKLSVEGTDGAYTIATDDSVLATEIYVIHEDIVNGDNAILESAEGYTDEVAGKYSKTEGDATTPGTGLRKEIEERDAATLDAAKKYADDKVKDITDGNYVKSFGGKTGDITLSAEGNVTLEMVENALKASYDDANAKGISWKETQPITTGEIDALFA